MYDRFTDRARKVMLLASEEAKRWNHEYIGAEHVLLALLQDGDGVAGMLLKHLGGDLGAVRRECEEALRKGPAAVAGRKLPQTPAAKDVVVHAIDHSRKLGHDYVGTEHLLLGLLQTGQGLAAQVLNRFGVTLPAVLTAMEHYAHGDRCQGEKPSAGDVRPAAAPLPSPPRAREERLSQFGTATFQRFAERARQVINLSNMQAQSFNHEYIGTEHLLLAILREGTGVAADVLRDLPLDYPTARRMVEKCGGSGYDMVTVDRLPATPRAQLVLLRAVSEADALGHEHVDTAHLLLALCEGDHLAGGILRLLGHSPDAIRESTLRKLAGENRPGSPPGS